MSVKAILSANVQHVPLIAYIFLCVHSIKCKLYLLKFEFHFTLKQRHARTEQNMVKWNAGLVFFERPEKKRSSKALWVHELNFCSHVHHLLIPFVFVQQQNT